MLTVTENASTIVKEITKQSPEEINALRITSESPQEADFAVTAVDAPEAGDQTVEQDGATIHLDQSAAQQLDDKVLDAAVDQNGGVQFSLVAQSDAV